MVVGGCVAPLGPGYVVEKQQIEVHFLAGSEASQPSKIHIQATYQLRNTGNQPLSLLEARLPRGRRVQLSALQTAWDGAPVEFTPSPDATRNSRLMLPAVWAVAARHKLQISYEVAPPSGSESGSSFTSDAFFLPAANWSPEILPHPGLFGFGGVPPKKWELRVRTPRDFRVHTSGGNLKTSRQGGEQIVRAVQTPADLYPFVVAGRYASAEIGDREQRVFLWTRSRTDAGSLQLAAQEITRTTAVYNAMFGSRSKQQGTPLWIVECPAARGCLSNTSAVVPALLLGDDAVKETAEMISIDTLVVDLTAGGPRLSAAVAPSLAASWLGYGQNPGFYEQEPPLSLLPAFAAAAGREALEGPAYRTEVIRRALARIPLNSQTRETSGKPKEEEPRVVRIKSFLFFYGLQDRFGREVFQKATTHMLQARRGRGFELSDLIAALEEQTHQNAAEFVRIWMKRPGVPDDFRARYESNSTSQTSAKETFP